MKHSEAAESLAAERYVLGEMPEIERDAFEAHFFDCETCAAEVREGIAFADSARDVFRAECRATELEKERKGRRWWQFQGLPFPVLATAAAMALAILAVYQNGVTIPALRRAIEPQELSTTMLRSVRGELPTITLQPGRSFFQLLVDLNAPESYTGYRCDFQTEAGKPLISFNATTTSGTLSLLLPAERFPDGRYTLKIIGFKSPSGTPPAEVESHTFSVVRAR
jgi:hypothetical protein